MANGETINQVKELLQNPAGMSNRTANILTLTLLSELYEKWEETNNKVEEMYPIVTRTKEAEKDKKDSDIYYKRLTVGTAITSGLLWLVHVVTSYLTARGSP